jgi:hypothetical protein
MDTYIALIWCVYMHRLYGCVLMLDQKLVQNLMQNKHLNLLRVLKLIKY